LGVRSGWASAQLLKGGLINWPGKLIVFELNLQPINPDDEYNNIVTEMPSIISLTSFCVEKRPPAVAASSSSGA